MGTKIDHFIITPFISKSTAIRQQWGKSWQQVSQLHISFTFHDKLILESSKGRQARVPVIFFPLHEGNMCLAAKGKIKDYRHILFTSPSCQWQFAPTALQVPRFTSKSTRSKQAANRSSAQAKELHEFRIPTTTGLNHSMIVGSS